jgi:BRCA1 C Terminus (BRCT) domain
VVGAARHDDQLLRCASVIREIHARFYGNSAAVETVPGILKSMKRSVLSGCTVSFSQLVPVVGGHTEAHVLYRFATALGARVSDDFNQHTTHLLAAHNRTKRAIACQARGSAWLLHPDWLFYCRWSLSRVLEPTFSLIEYDSPASYPKMRTSDDECGVADTKKRGWDGGIKSAEEFANGDVANVIDDDDAAELAKLEIFHLPYKIPAKKHLGMESHQFASSGGYLITERVVEDDDEDDDEHSEKRDIQYADLMCSMAYSFSGEYCGSGEDRIVSGEEIDYSDSDDGYGGSGGKDWNDGGLD